MQVDAGDKLYAYVYLDPDNMPSEVMLEWNDGGGWEHRAYWGANNIPCGTDGTESRRYVGPLPQAGVWTRLEVPASAVGLEGRTVSGMSFKLYGGRANLDKTGKVKGNISPVPLDGLSKLYYNAANNRLSNPGFEYDPAGNQTKAVVAAGGYQQQYRYDCAGRLAQVLDASGNVLATYSYGAGNQRLMSVEGGVAKYYAWDGGQIIAEYEAWGTNALIWKTSYVYLGGRLLATTSGADGSETRFHHPDRLGTRLVTNASDGAVVSEQWTLPFGNMQPFVSAPGGENPYQHPTLTNPSKKRFTSYDRSDATGLDYAVNRFYSPQQGRFTQVDPIGMGAASLTDPQTLNLYAYCGNDPVNFDDPSGLRMSLIVDIGSGGIDIFIGGGGWRIIKKAAKAVAKTIVRVISSGRVGFSGPGFRTPPTFPGNLPGASINIPPIFRTPPFVGGFLAAELAELEDIGLVLRIETWEWVGVGALSGFLQAGGGRRQGGRRGRRRAQQPPCGAQLTGDADVDRAARYIYAEGSDDETEMRGIGQTFVNRYNSNRREFGGQNAARVWRRLSVADDKGGSRSFRQAANNNTLRRLSPGDCNRYRTASAAARYVLRDNPNLNQPGGGILPGNDYYYFLGRGAHTPGYRVGATTFYNRFPGK